MFWQKMWACFINGVDECRRYCFVWGINKWGYGHVSEMKTTVEGKGLRVNVDKTKVCSYYLGRKVVFEDRSLWCLW